MSGWAGEAVISLTALHVYRWCKLLQCNLSVDFYATQQILWGCDLCDLYSRVTCSPEHVVYVDNKAVFGQH